MFDSKSDEGIFLGYSINSRAYRVFNKRTETVMESINVVVDDEEVERPRSKEESQLNSTAPSDIIESSPNESFSTAPETTPTTSKDEDTPVDSSRKS
jgi:hypothetical protein